MSARADLIRIFEFEPDLLDGVPEQHAKVIRDRIVTECLTWDTGLVSPGDSPAQDAVFCVVLEGLLARRVDAYGRRSVEVLGRGDVFSAREDLDDPGRARVTWRVHAKTRVALLDHRWVEGMARWPQVTASIVDRLGLRAQRLTEQLAIGQMRDLDRRVLCVLWSLAARWGTVGPSTVTLRLAVDHEMLAALASAQRPSVTAALGRLRAEGHVAGSSKDAWQLHGAPPSEIRHDLAMSSH